MNLSLRFFPFVAFLFPAILPSATAAPGADVVVYGGTSGGIAAALQVKRMGRTVVLIEPTRHLGGLTTGGLGATDIGNKGAIGGISREFYQRMHRYYQADAVWKFSPKPPDRGDDTQWTFEPSAATKVYQQMIEEAGVPVVLGERLDLANGIRREGPRLQAIVMESGSVFEGSVFIDATYEGDLMAEAGVQYHVGREANAVYGETLNGVQTARATKHQFIVDVDPWIVPGDPASGLLPGIQTEPAGPDGSGDHRLQAYNFRLTTTDVPENRIPWPKPAKYEERRYELLLRNFEAGDHRSPWNPIFMPNRKTDTNNNFAFSTDNIGMNYGYPEGDYATRAAIIAEHRDYTAGLMWTLANHPRVPAKIREEFQRLGLAADEFTENDHWPRQLYVREVRRMVSDYVMTEKNCTRAEVVADSVGMGAYNMDSHNVRRHLTPEGKVRNEGDIQVASKPYPISYRSIRPRASECTNLLAPLVLSSSHIAFGSIRMEPVFMVLGQSAATAAVHALEEKKTVQEIDYPRLQARLLADRQVLDFIPPPSKTSSAQAPPKPEGIVIDQQKAQRTGFEALSEAARPFFGSDYAHDDNQAKGQQKARFTAAIPEAGTYEIRAGYTSHPNRATNVPVRIQSAGGWQSRNLNQRQKPEVDGWLQPILTLSLDAGEHSVEILNEGTDGYVIIDAVQWVKKP